VCTLQSRSLRFKERKENLDNVNYPVTREEGVGETDLLRLGRFSRDWNDQKDETAVARPEASLVNIVKMPTNTTKTCTKRRRRFFISYTDGSMAAPDWMPRRQYR